MPQKFDHQTIEAKWLKAWEEAKLFHQRASAEANDKLYLLFAFAYPSGSGLHVGHVESKTALDILARYYRMKGKDVFFPVGWDAFGLPAENYAVKTGVHPSETTKKAIDTFRRQIKRIGISYAWDSETATSHPEYYRWTQWLFLKLFEKGLAYQDLGRVNWCPSCQTVLANEQVVNGLCERCDTPVVQKAMKQWYFKITDYADELISGLEHVDWPEPTKRQQLEWIGKRQGVNVTFKVQSSTFNTKITTFTTRIDTIYGITFVVVSPEQTQAWIDSGWEAPAEVKTYLDQASHKTEEERKIGEKDKTGVDTGLKAINPVNQETVPVYVADYVLAEYGTGAVMGVPAHDTRDLEFAQKYSLPINPVIETSGDDITAYGHLVNSSDFSGQTSEEAMVKIPNKFPQAMEVTTQYRLRDWLISRQRYWGAPIPIVYDPDGNPHPIKAEHLPWILPTDVEFKPTGESPLKASKELQNRVRDLYGEGWTPEYDTMDTFVDSSWYFLRFPDARNRDEFADKERLKTWLPVDFYMIGPEHIVLHLLYSRFLTKFLRDEGYLNFNEPFMKMRHQGMILGPDHKKMSKSKGNVIDPDQIIKDFGADTLRLYEMFMGPIEADKPWNTESVQGVYRFLSRVYRRVGDAIANPAAATEPGLKSKLHQTLEQVEADTRYLKYNTAIARMMEFLNSWDDAIAKAGEAGPVISFDDLSVFIRLLAPYAPFLSDELWQQLNQSADTNQPIETVHLQAYPQVDHSALKAQAITFVIQVNGKLRDTLVIDSTQYSAWPNPHEELLSTVRNLQKITPYLEGKDIKKTIIVDPNKKHQGLLNLVVG